MTYRRPRAWLLAILALVSAACSGGGGSADAPPPPPSSSTDAHDAADHDHHEHPADEAPDHAGRTDDHHGHDAARGPGRPMTTAETLAAIAAMDPQRLAGLHDHHHAPAAARVHPNGIDPHRIVIPKIGVDATVIRLGTSADGTMEVPRDFAEAGWFSPGPRPGRVGPAVIAGHVDSRAGPAVFFRLTDLEPGDEIEVHDDDGEVVVFAVRATEQVPKDDFPTERVYAGTSGPELRLITCGGIFDRTIGHYDDNIIVYAERVER